MFTAEELRALAKSLHSRARDLEYVGDQLSYKSHAAHWTCAKADRYRGAMDARKTETHRLAKELNELAHWVLAQAQAAEAEACQPTPKP